MHKYFILFLLFLRFVDVPAQIMTGADQLNAYLPFLRDKKIGLVVNQTSRIGEKHLVDSLLLLGVDIQAVFAPEHGFRGDHGAGETVKSGTDPQTGLKIISLYGNHKKPSAKDLENIQLLIFDVQDVGARFYTYISTMHYVMEACAEQQIPLLVLDRPNPHGHYVDGPVLDTAYRSFVGMHPVPVVHGMTIGEYALMINGEKWLKNGVQCGLEVIPVKNYTHRMRYSLPVAPSPNLPNDRAVALYPQLCFFEGTRVSVGRGTDHPFQMIGMPGFRGGDTAFTPLAVAHAAPHPPYKGEQCGGYSLLAYADSLLDFQTPGRLSLELLLRMYRQSPDRPGYFIPFFDKLAGSSRLRKDLEKDAPLEAIYESWQPGIQKFKNIRRKYLLYADFE
jgi:uncharacterized protein YbbC (DUF1343 family)